MDNDGEDSIAEKFETVHRHLDYADRTLDTLTKDIHEEINSIVDDTEVDVAYDLDTGSFEAHLPVDEITARINGRLDAPFLVRAEGTKLVVEDIRRTVDIEIEQFEEKLSSRRQYRGVKGLVYALEDSHDDGAPVEKVLTLLEYTGMARSEAEHELDKLKQKGEVYEPAPDILRTT